MFSASPWVSVHTNVAHVPTGTWFSTTATESHSTLHILRADR